MLALEPSEAGDMEDGAGLGACKHVQKLPFSSKLPLRHHRLGRTSSGCVGCVQMSSNIIRTAGDQTWNALLNDKVVVWYNCPRTHRDGKKKKLRGIKFCIIYRTGTETQNSADNSFLSAQMPKFRAQNTPSDSK